MKSAMSKVAEKSVVASAVSGLVGGIIGGCATKLTTDIIENIAPAPVSLGMKVTYGVGSYAIGGIVGMAVADKMTEEMQEMSGGLLTVKATFKEVQAMMNRYEEE